MELNEQTLRDILREQREEYERHSEGQRLQYEKHAEGQRLEYQRYLGTLAEDFKSQVKLVAEFQSSLAEEIRSMREQLTDLQERVALLEGEVAGLRNITLEIRSDIANVKDQLTVMRKELHEKAGREELAALEVRVGELERAVRSK